MSLREKFTRHPASVGETYGEHFVAAMGFSVAMLRTSFCCALHAVFPFLFERTASRCIEDLHERLIVNRARAANTGSAGNRAASTGPAARKPRPGGTGDTVGA